LVAISIYLWKSQEKTILEQIQSGVESKARSYSSETEIRFSNIYKSLERLSSRGEPHDDIDLDAWAKDAAFYIDAFTGIKSVAWVDEAYIIREIVPIQDGLYLNQKAGEVIGDPLDINLWVPVYEAEAFKGYILGTMAIDALISPVLTEMNDDYMLQLSDENTVIFNSENWKDSQEGLTFSKTVTLENTAVLNLTFAPTDELLDDAIADARKTLVFGLLFSFITIMAVYFAQKYNATALISKSHYLDLFNASQDAIFIINLKGEYEDANPAALEMVGYSLTELHQMRASDLRPQAKALPPDALKQMWSEKNVQEISLRHKDGQSVLVELTISPINEGGIQKSVLGIARDITERKRTENRLLLHSEIISNMDEGVYLIRAQDGIIVYTNPALERIFGYAPGEMIGKHVSIVNAPTENSPEETAKEIGAIIEKEGDWKGEVLNARKDGMPFWSQAIVSVFDHSEHGSVWLSVHTDITERKQAEEEKRQMESHLRQQQKLESIGTLASGVAHEINNPIMGIMNYATLISERLDPSQSQLREFADEIGHETERVATIVRNLLTFARQEKQSHSPARITDIVDGTLSLIQTIIKRDQITLELDVPDDLPEIKCRSQQIQQVLMNLLTNARDALNARYLEYDPDKIISMSVRLFEKEGRRWLRTTIEDHGVGIPVEIRERIFDPFYTTKDRATGTGLGLSISLGIVQDHHGELTFESEKDQPTRFYLDLPVDNGWDL
jgi:PAS domain S-box-containing protein